MTEWTQGRRRSFITSTLRGGMRRYPAKWQALDNAFVGSKTNEKTGRMCKHYKCNACKNDFPTKDVQVDHISPVVDPEVGFVSWDVYIERMYCEVENLQVLCTTCHNKKTKEEKRKKNDYSKKDHQE